MTSGIYMIEHRESGKRYIGRSVDIEQRWYQHKSEALRKEKRSNNPMHNAIRKYGPEAFNWKILVSAPERLHATLERQFIEDWCTYKPHGYNLGGTEGGFPPRAAIDRMAPEEKARWEEVLQRVARTGHEALKELRQDPEYEAWYRSVKSEGSRKREANIKARREADPEYDAKERQRRRDAALKNRNPDRTKFKATIKEKMANDPEFAAAFRESRRRANARSIEVRRAKGFAKWTDERKAAFSENHPHRAPEVRASKSVKMKQRHAEKVTCPHCGRSGSIISFRPYHFDNCKHKETE